MRVAEEHLGLKSVTRVTTQGLCRVLKRKEVLKHERKN